MGINELTKEIEDMWVTRVPVRTGLQLYTGQAGLKMWEDYIEDSYLGRRYPTVKNKSIRRKLRKYDRLQNATSS